MLYKEGDSADYVYIIQSGDFQVFKKLISFENKMDNIDLILENPLKANKHKNKLFKGNSIKKEEIVQLFIIGRGNTAGEEDVV